MNIINYVLAFLCGSLSYYTYIWASKKIRHVLFMRELRVDEELKKESDCYIKQFIKQNGGDAYLDQFIEKDPKKAHRLTIPLMASGPYILPWAEIGKKKCRCQNVGA